MKLQTDYKPRIVRGSVEIYVPHNGGEIAFASPAIGPSNYQNVGKQILKDGQQVPTGDYTASLLHATYCDDSVANEPEFKNVRSLMKTNWLWVFNNNLWTSNGVYVIQDEEATGRSKPVNIRTLEKRLKSGKEISGVRFSRDGRVIFVPKEIYLLGDNTPETFAKDGFIIASCGQEGAEKLGEVSAKFGNKPYIYGVHVQEGQMPEQRVSAVLGLVGRLGFGGRWGDDGGSHAFGVRK